MARGIKQRFWTTKPPVGTPLNWRSPLARGMTSAWLFNEIRGNETAAGGGTKSPAVDVVTGSHLGSLWSGNIQAAVSLTKGNGVRITAANTTDYLDLGLDSALLTTAGGMTVVMAQQKTDTVNRGAASFGVATGVDSDRCGSHLPFSDGTVYWDYGGVGAGNRLSVTGLSFGNDIWILTTGARGQEIWQNGFLRGSNSNNGTRTASTAQFRLGGGVQGNSTSDLVQYNFLYLYKRQIAVAEAVDISMEPFRMFVSPAPRVRFFFIPAVAAPLTTTRLKLSQDTKLTLQQNTKLRLVSVD